MLTHKLHLLHSNNFLVSIVHFYQILLLLFLDTLLQCFVSFCLIFALINLTFLKTTLDPCGWRRVRVYVCKLPKLAVFCNLKSFLLSQRRLLPENMTCYYEFFFNSTSSVSLNQEDIKELLPSNTFTLEAILIFGNCRYILHFIVRSLLYMAHFCWCFLRYVTTEPSLRSLYFFPFISALCLI